MKRLPQIILEDLCVGQSTASAIADREGAECAHIAAVCNNLLRQELVELAPHPTLRIYRITLAGRESLMPAKTKKQTTTTP